MKAIILAAGRGQRLDPYTQERPKCQLAIGERTLLQWQLDSLRACGISDICIVKGYAGNEIPNTLRSYSNPEFATTNMVASLFCASKELTGPCIICYADILYEPRVVRALLEAHPGDINVVVDTSWIEYYALRYPDPYAEAESLICSAGGLIVDIGRSLPARNEIDGQFIGMVSLTERGAKTFLEHYNSWRTDFWSSAWVRGRSLKASFMTDFLQALIDQGIPVRAVPIQHGWLEFDSVHDYEQVQLWYKQNSMRSLFDFNAIPQ